MFDTPKKYSRGKVKKFKTSELWCYGWGWGESKRGNRRNMSPEKWGIQDQGIMIHFLKKSCISTVNGKAPGIGKKESAMSFGHFFISPETLRT
jgi:hypothetical protein